MRTPPTLHALFETAESVRSLREGIHSHLRGRSSEADLRALAARLRRQIRTNHEAQLTCLDIECYGREHEIRRADVEIYHRELAEGFGLDVVPAVAASISVDRLAERAGVPRVNRVMDGLGLIHTARFASPATGRSFSAWSTPSASGSTTLCIPRQDTTLGMVDLVECFLWDVVEEPDRTERLDLDLLPDVALLRKDDNGNRAEVRTFRSYAGAMQEARRFESLGHKQRYWVEVRREPRW